MDSKKTVWDKITDFAKVWGVLVTIISFGVTFVVIVQTRIFESSEQRHKVINKYENGLSPEQEQRKYFQDSLETASKLESRRLRDSTFILIREDQLEMKEQRLGDIKRQDSLRKLDSDQIFQIKEQLKNN